MKRGPRGLGVAIGLGVDDLEVAYRWCLESGCEVTSDPRDEAYGDRVFEFVDRDGYLWEVSQPITEVSADEAVDAVRKEWFGAS